MYMDMYMYLYTIRVRLCICIRTQSQRTALNGHASARASSPFCPALDHGCVGQLSGARVGLQNLTVLHLAGRLLETEHEEGRPFW